MEQEIKRLAEYFHQTRPDIAEALHDILEGKKWNHHRIREESKYVHYHVLIHDSDVKDIPKEIVITYDVAEDEIYVRDERTGRELDQIITTKSNFILP